MQSRLHARLARLTLVALAVAACGDPPSAPSAAPTQQADPRRFFKDPVNPDVGAIDTLTVEFDWGGHINVRRGANTYLARGVKSDWKIGDPIPRKANGQEYYEWQTEPPIGSVPPPKNTGPVNQENNCLSEINTPGFGHPKARREVQSLVWEVDNRLPRRELSTGDFTAFFRSSTSGQGNGNWRMCVKLDSIRILRTAWEYVHNTSGVYWWWDTYGYGTTGTNGTDQAAGWAWCYGKTSAGQPCQNPPAVVTKISIEWSRYCNYFEPNQTSQQWWAGNHGAAGEIILDKPSWSIQGYAGFDFQTHTAAWSWGGDDYSGQTAPFGAAMIAPAPSLTICAFSSNNYDQRQGQATWRIDQNYEYVP